MFPEWCQMFPEWCQMFPDRWQVLDTPGLEPSVDPQSIQGRAMALTGQLIGSSQLALLLVDGKHGLHPDDQVIVKWLRKTTSLPVVLVANKCEQYVLGNIQGTFREHSGNTQGTFSAHSGNIQRTYREHSGNIWLHSGNIRGTFSQVAAQDHLATGGARGQQMEQYVDSPQTGVNSPQTGVDSAQSGYHTGRRGPVSGNIQGTFREHSGNIQGTISAYGSRGPVPPSCPARRLVL
jgi:hypothetical protein